ncbi:MAG: polyribonucleotide nucleotidyltransferase [Bacteroidetes bacterium HGW-Bacteroidetes-21]|nr:MAG: polyribonucleotide nucleotidyltransferase [Bacteroidetes bacterium HGW-Bacteroidetes-21]
MKITKKTITLPDGRLIEIETGKLAKQAHGSVVIRMENIMLLATVVSATEAKEDLDFMPLSVEYREKFYAVGRFPGGFMKRESRPSNTEILVSRLVDRVLRPLFPSDYHAETFVNVDLISGDFESMPDALAGLAASCAMTISDIPFQGPISEVRVSRIDGQFVINPSRKMMDKADISMIIGATYENIMMVEGEMAEVSEQEMIDAIKFAHEAIKVQCQMQIDLAKELGVVKRTYCHENNDEDLKKKLHDFAWARLCDIARNPKTDKHERILAMDAIKKEFVETITDITDVQKSQIKRYYHKLEKDAVREVYLHDNIRLDGRKMNEVRPIWGEVDYLPMAHGSAVFTRGETQSLTTVTLGTKLDEQMIDGAVFQGHEKFILHYNFPPFSTGEARPYRGTGRREIGHGNLAHRALLRQIPTDIDVNPYTIRVVSDILESNGSSSMATVCAGTMALMDAGVKILKPVSGIAMGMISDSATGKFVILSDILGDEDHLGDMDFKVTGTPDGITATQMDIKVDGLSYEVLTQALMQAKEGRAHILGEMMKVISTPREDYKPHAPRIQRMLVPKDTIGAIIGPGGKVIQDIQKRTATTIVIEEVENNGIVEIAAPGKEAIDAAIKIIKGIIGSFEIGEVFDGTVKSIMEYGAFVELLPGKEALLHISEIAWERLKRVEDVLKMGDVIKVKLIDIDPKGRLKLSHKVLIPKPENLKPEENK